MGGRKGFLVDAVPYPAMIEKADIEAIKAKGKNVSAFIREAIIEKLKRESGN